MALRGVRETGERLGKPTSKAFFREEAHAHLLDGAGDPLRLVGLVLRLGGICGRIAQGQLRLPRLFIGFNYGLVDGRDSLQCFLRSSLIIIHSPIEV